VKYEHRVFARQKIVHFNRGDRHGWEIERTSQTVCRARRWENGRIVEDWKTFRPFRMVVADLDNAPSSPYSAAFNEAETLRNAVYEHLARLLAISRRPVRERREPERYRAAPY
jgi:hypothetical protein